MSKQIISTENAPAAVGPYSQAVVANGFVFTAGQIALVPATGQMLEGDVTAQTHQVFANLKAVLAAAGSSLEDAVKMTVFLQNMGDFAAMNAVYGEYFGAQKPARTTVETKFANPTMKVEIDCIAYQPKA